MLEKIMKISEVSLFNIRFIKLLKRKETYEN